MWPATATLGDNVATYVSPTYIRVTPLADGWNSWFLYDTDTNGQTYTIGSGGKDGTTSSTVVPGPTTDFNADIVYSNGQFIQYPEGVQR